MKAIIQRMPLPPSSSRMRVTIQRTRLLVLSCVLMGSAAQAFAAPATDAPPAPFSNGDASIGKTLSDRDCVACHARQMAGDADKMYLRSNRRVNTPRQLLAQVSYCNSELGSGYFPEDEEHVAAYLNRQYYKFKP